MNLGSPLLVAGCALALGAPALAQDLYVGSRTTLVTQNDFLDGSSTLVGVCGGQVQSMTVVNDEVFIGDLNGNIYHYEPSTGFFTYLFTSANDARALVGEGGDLLVGGTDNSVLRYDLTGTLQATLNATLPVTAMVVAGGQLIVGSVSGIIQSGDPNAGNFQFWGVCGNDVLGLATDGVDLFASDAGSAIWRFELASQSLIETYPAGGLGLAIGFLEDDLMVGTEGGSLVRMDPIGGTVKSTLNAATPVDGLAIVDVPEPGQSFCFGTACPCGNDDPNDSCATSIGFGSGILARGTTSVAADDLEIVVYDLPVTSRGASTWPSRRTMCRSVTACSVSAPRAIRSRDCRSTSPVRTAC